MIRLSLTPIIIVLRSNHIILHPYSRFISRCPRLTSSICQRFYLQCQVICIRYNCSASNTQPESKQTELTSAENQKKLILTVPNLLTSLRIASIPFINYYFLNDRHDIACGLFIMASFTDFLDGFIARNFPNQLSHLGSILDPLADKLLIGV